MAQNAWLQALGISAAVGTGGAALEAFGAWLSPSDVGGSQHWDQVRHLAQSFSRCLDWGRPFGNESDQSEQGGNRRWFESLCQFLIAALEDTFGGKVIEPAAIPSCSD